VVHQDDDEYVEERGLDAMNLMHEEIQEKRCRVEAHERLARLCVIRQKADEAREELRRMDEYLAALKADPNESPSLVLDN